MASVARAMVLPGLEQDARADEGGTNFFPTPGWVAELLFDHLPTAGVRRVLEPSAGDGALCQVARRRLPEAAIDAVELRPDLCDRLRSGDWRRPGDRVHEANFHHWAADCTDRYDLIIANPPYHMVDDSRRAEPDRFIDSALPLLATGGRLAMLLRINWAGANARRHVINDLRPEVLLITKRIKFVATKRDGSPASTPNECHAWYIWTPGAPSGQIRLVG